MSASSRDSFRQNFLEAYFNMFYACAPTFTRKRQRVARRTPQKVSTQKHCTPGATFFTFRVPHPESRLAVWRKKRVPRELVFTGIGLKYGFQPFCPVQPHYEKSYQLLHASHHTKSVSKHFGGPVITSRKEETTPESAYLPLDHDTV